MKKFNYCLAGFFMFLSLSSNAFSQITVTTSDLPNFFGVGNSWFNFSNSDTVMMNVGIPSNSTPQTWTLPTVIFADSSRIDNVLPSSTPYASDFSGATYCQTSSQLQSGLTFSFYQYMRLSNDSLYLMGVVQRYQGTYGGGTIDTSIIKDTTQFLTHIPIQLGEVIAAKTDTVNEGGGVIEVITNIQTYDAYGTLNLPIGSFQALRSSRVNAYMVYYDGALTNTFSTHTYNWVTREGHQLSVSVDTASASNVHVHDISLTYINSTPPTSVIKPGELPKSFSLGQNYPNPFNPTTIIRFAIQSTSFVSLKIYDILGREVSTLANEQKSPGIYEVNFNASRLSSGIYFYQLRAGTNVETKRMMLIK